MRALLDKVQATITDFIEQRDALWLRVRIECRTQTSEACRVAAHSYLRAAPSGSAKAELATRVTRQAS